MNKTKKGLLTARSIITIVASAFAIIGSIALFLIGGMFTEGVLKESYRADPEYTYYEEADGDYYFTTIEEGEEVIIYDDEIEMLAEVVSAVFVIAGMITLGISIAKLVLAIRILIMNNREKYAKASVIALLVLSVLNTNILEAVLLIVAMCQKDNIENSENKDELSTTNVQLTDISNE